MRTEQFEEGYNSCRIALQHLLKEDLDIDKLIELASYPYYKRDGKDWNFGDKPIEPYKY